MKKREREQGSKTHERRAVMLRALNFLRQMDREERRAPRWYKRLLKLDPNRRAQRERQLAIWIAMRDGLAKAARVKDQQHHVAARKGCACIMKNRKGIDR